MNKRIISLLLSILMVFSMLPLAIIADEDVEQTPPAISFHPVDGDAIQLTTETTPIMTDAVSITTIAAGAVTFVVGPITGTALGAASEVLALSVTVGLVKTVFIMIFTPLAAKRIGLTSPKMAMIFGGLVGSTSGISAGLAATDPNLVPYGTMVATFYSGTGCLLCPSLLYAIVNLFF